MIEVDFYSKSVEKKWDNFLLNSKGQTFMFKRSYMDYHSDRFIDRSIVVYENNEIVAIMPACLGYEENSIISHSGLTFGSFVVNESLKSIKTIEYLYNCIKFLNKNGIIYLYFKQIPSFYSTISTDEIDYVFFLLQSEIYRIDIAFAINYTKTIPYQERRNRSIKKGIKNGII